MATVKTPLVLKALALAGALCAFATAHAKTNTFYVAEGATLSVDQVVAASNFTFSAGDCLRKTGKGQLTATTKYKDTKLDILVEEGVYFVDVTAHSQGASLVVKDGATIYAGSSEKALDGNWNVSFEGSGTGEGDYLGAIAVRFANTDSFFGGANTSYTMTGDATIYTVGGMNAIFSGVSASSGTTLNMNGHTLTIRGKLENSIFRPRWKWTVRNPGPIVVKNGVFARHNTTNDISPNIPLVSFVNGASMDTYSTESIWGNVDAFEFEDGTTLKKSASYGVSNVTLTMKKATGPVAISFDATVTISQEFGVRGTDMANDYKLTSANALTFSDGCKLSVTNWGGVLLSPGSVYTVASSETSVFGTPELTGDAAAVFTVANTGTALTLTV